jgi:hypothetical protein
MNISNSLLNNIVHDSTQVIERSIFGRGGDYEYLNELRVNLQLKELALEIIKLRQFVKTFNLEDKTVRDALDNLGINYDGDNNGKEE